MHAHDVEQVTALLSRSSCEKRRVSPVSVNARAVVTSVAQRIDAIAKDAGEAC